MRYRLTDGSKIRENGTGLVLESPLGRLPLPLTDPAVREALRRLIAGEAEVDEVAEQMVAGGSSLGLAELYRCLDTLARSHCLVRELELGGRVVARMRPLVAAAEVGPAALSPGATFRLSRFVVLRPRPGGGLLAEVPLARGKIEAEGSAAGLLTALAGDATVEELATATGASGEEVERFLRLLLAEGFVGEVDADGDLPEDRDETLRQWDAHDLYFHSRCRLGRHADPVGGNFRFKGELEPQPCVKPPPEGPAIPLLRPDLGWVAAGDPPFQAVLESRASVRQHGPVPLSVDELGVFLYRAARNRGTTSTALGELTSRPYPSGGASYELEVYVTVEACRGLERGFYYYDPSGHRLIRLAAAGDDTALLLRDAWRATAELCWPQVLFTFAARFQRVSWKYDAMAYATILKNVGAAYQTFYLVATAMHLAPCGLGIGDPDRFCGLAGTDYLRESSVGEFALGSRGE